MVRYIIVDDEHLAHEVIKDYAGYLSHLQLIESCFSAKEAMSVLSRTKIDLMFLDINMPQINGFQFLKTLVNPPATVVTSAHEHYALEGYELNVVDYLLKPFSLERFLTAVGKLIRSDKSIPIVDETHLQSEFFFVKEDKRYVQLAKSDVLYIEAYGNYCKVHLFNSKVIITHESISHFEMVLRKDFVRVHKSFLVSIHQIDHIEGSIIKIKSRAIPIGQTYRRVIADLVKSNRLNST